MQDAGSKTRRAGQLMRASGDKVQDQANDHPRHKYPEHTAQKSSEKAGLRSVRLRCSIRLGLRLRHAATLLETETAEQVNLGVRERMRERYGAR